MRPSSQQLGAIIDRGSLFRLEFDFFELIAK
jgi:hypothetical protein